MAVPQTLGRAGPKPLSELLLAYAKEAAVFGTKSIPRVCHVGLGRVLSDARMDEVPKHTFRICRARPSFF